MKMQSRDYTQTKDAYEGNRESSVYKDSPVPSDKKPGKDTYDDSASDIMPKGAADGHAAVSQGIPDEVPRRDGPGGE